MRVIAVNRFYRPDHSATSQMLTDLAEHLAASGSEVTVITSRLSYEDRSSLPPREHLAGVEVRRVWSTAFGRGRLVGRAIDYAAFYVSAFIELLRVGRAGDLVIAKTDPPLISVATAVAAKLKGMRLVNWCQDLFPEVAAALGMRWAGGPVGRVLKAVRNWSLRQAEFNAVLDRTMARRLEGEGISPSRVRILPNWADRDIRPVNRAENPLRPAWGLGGAFVVGYSGNLGRAHMPAKVAELVAATKDIDGLVWLFIGGGAGMAAVREAAGGSPSVIFKPYQPREMLSQSLSVPDIHLITLDPGCEGYILPSKLYGVRAAGRPILFIGDPQGAIAEDIRRRGGGFAFEPTVGPAAVIDALKALMLAPERAALHGLAPDATSAALKNWRRALFGTGHAGAASIYASDVN